MAIGNRFHSFECQAVDFNLEDENSIFQMTHRVVLEALGIFGKLERLQQFFKGRSQPKTIFDFDLTNANVQEQEKDFLLAVNSLQRNKIPEKMLPLMDQHVELMKSITRNSKHQKFLDSFMRKQMEIVITNSFGICDINGAEVGSGIFPLSSFFNHSCSPNVIRVAVDNKLVFVVSRPVEQNCQLFVCYRSNFFECSKEKRQEELLESYRFKCSCEACDKDFPQVSSLEFNDDNFIVPASQILSVESAREEFKANCGYIQRHFKNFPTVELCKLIERNQNVLVYLAHHLTSLSY